MTMVKDLYSTTLKQRHWLYGWGKKSNKRPEMFLDKTEIIYNL